MKSIFQDIDYLKIQVKDETSQKILKELGQNFHLLKTKSGLSQLKKRFKERMTNPPIH